jgi:hypothetical protein
MTGEAQALKDRITELETELRFVENNMRQLAYNDVLPRAMKDWANRIRKLLAKGGGDNA